MYRNCLQRAVLPMTTCSLLVLIAGCGGAKQTTPAAGNQPSPEYFTQLCYESRDGMSKEKRSGVDQMCAAEAKDIAEARSLPPKQIDYSPLPPIPPAVESERDRMYGIRDDLPKENDIGKHNYIENFWLGTDLQAWAGASGTDSSLGVVILFTRPSAAETTLPTVLGTYYSSDKDGALHFTQENDGVLRIAAKNGAKYDFNVNTRLLVKR